MKNIQINLFAALCFGAILVGCSTNKIDEKALEKKWKFDTVYSKDLDNYIAALKAQCDTITDQLRKEAAMRSVKDAFKQILNTTIEIKADSIMEETIFVMGHPCPFHAKWSLIGDRKIIFDVTPQKEHSIQVKDSIRAKDSVYYTTETLTIGANEGEKDTFKIAKLTKDTLVLTGRNQIVGNGTIVLKAVK